MKRISLYIVILCLVLLTSSCTNQVIELRGLDSFSYYTCSLSLTSCLIPSDFLSAFPPCDGDYYYRDSVEGNGGVKTIMYLVYPETTYGIAKQYCIENMTLGEIRWEDFEGFTFIDNLALETMYSPDSQTGYPRWFNMFAYNDSLHILLFFGYYGLIAAEADEKELALTDFPAFLKVIYSDCFDN